MCGPRRYSSPGLPGRKRPSVGAAHLGLRPRDREPDRLGPGERELRREDGPERRALRQPVAVVEPGGHHPVQRLDRLRRHRGAAVRRDPHRREVVAADVAPEREQLVDRGDEEERRDAVPGDPLENLPRVVLLLQHHGRAARQEGHQLGVEPRHVEQGQREEAHVVLAVPERGAAGVDVEQGVPVGDHRPLGETRGPRRVKEHGHVVGSRRRRRGDRVRREGVAERKGTFPPSIHEEPGPHPPDTFLPGDLVELLLGRHDDRGGAIRQDVGDFGRGKPVIHRHRDAPGRDRPEIRDDELRHILQQESDAFPRSDGAGP